MKPIFDESGVTLYCGDSRLIIPELPVYDLLVTDPPYCNGYKTNSPEVLADFDAIAGDDDMGMVQDVLRESWRGLKTNRHGYVFGPITPGQVVSAEVGGVTELVWDKSSMSAGDLTAAWGRSHEPIWFGVERHSGAILIVSSTAAYQGVPYMATYAASKGFGLLFAEALAREVEHCGVHVCALCHGPTASEFQKVAGVPDDLSMGLEPADRVAREGLRALAAGEHSVISGFTNWWGWKYSAWFPGGWSHQRPRCCSVPGTAANYGRRARSRNAAAPVLGENVWSPVNAAIKTPAASVSPRFGVDNQYRFVAVPARCIAWHAPDSGHGGRPNTR